MYLLWYIDTSTTYYVVVEWTHFSAPWVGYVVCQDKGGPATTGRSASPPCKSQLAVMARGAMRASMGPPTGDGKWTLLRKCGSSAMG